MNKDNRQSYTLEYVATAVERINEWVTRCPEQHAYLTEQQRTQWASYPALIRSHRLPYLFIDPNKPIAEIMESGRIGPKFDSSILTTSSRDHHANQLH